MPAEEYSRLLNFTVAAHATYSVLFTSSVLITEYHQDPKFNAG